MATEIKRSICRFCHARCRVAVSVENGQVIRKLEPDQTDPRVRMYTPPSLGCARLQGAIEYASHPDRVKFPLKRKGERGANKWEQISWDQALDEIAVRLGDIRDRYGAESLMLTNGTGRTDAWTGRRFLNLFGSPNIVSMGHICFGPFIATSNVMLGWILRHVFGAQPFEQGTGKESVTKLGVLVGINPAESHLHIWNNMLEMKKKGTKFIVIDPRPTASAKMADLWLQIRPGTDTVLLMSMLNVIIEENLYDKKFVEKWCHGFNMIAEAVRLYPPEKAAAITMLPAEQIRKAAHMYATIRPACFIEGMGLEHLENNIEGLQSLISIAAITGNIDVKGGNYLPAPTETFIRNEVLLEANDLLSPEQRKKQIGSDRFKFIGWPGKELMMEQNLKFWGREAKTYSFATYPLVLRAVISGNPYPVRAAISQHSNPMITMANIKMVHKALKSLDLYVVKDYWLTPSAQLADYVLPTAFWAERHELSEGSGDSKVMAGEPALPNMVPGQFEHYTDYEFFSKLGRRIGQEKYWPWENLLEVRNYQLEPLGMTFQAFMDQKNGVYAPQDEYKKYEKMGGFGTPTGKIELCPTILETLGYDSRPAFEEPRESLVSRPDLAKDYPFILITGGRFRPYFHSEHRQIETVRKKRPDPQVQMNPETAKKLGIAEGDWVWIESPRGVIKQRCQYLEGLDSKVVHCEHGWWFPEMPGQEPWLHGVWESNVDVLTNDDPEICNKRFGSWPLKTNLCNVYKVKTFSKKKEIAAAEVGHLEVL